jgi:hypothetical protein
MDEDEQPRTPFSSRIIKLLAGTAFATALVVSLGWAIAWRDLNRLHRADFEQFERRINQLDSQLDDQLETMRELLKEYAGSQDARIALESRLAAAETQLERARADVETYESGDWESRFRNEQQRADDLSRAAADLEQQLAEQKQAAEGLAADAKAVKKQKSDLAAARSEIDKLKRQLAHFTAQRQLPADGDGDSYRRSRMQSLSTALEGRASGERVAILQNVVPAIPGGVSGGELATLMAGMDSADVRAAITALRGHLRPLDGDGSAALLALMQPEDAAAIVDLLAAEPKTPAP